MAETFNPTTTLELLQRLGLSAGMHGDSHPIITAHQRENLRFLAAQLPALLSSLKDAERLDTLLNRKMIPWPGALKIPVLTREDLDDLLAANRPLEEDDR